VIVTVAWATRDVQDVVPVELERGATLADAVRASGLIAQYGIDPQRVRYALHGARAESDTVVAPGDRVEIVGPLIVDPKVARARRARRKAKPSTAPTGR
jgi:putative ubiquitin-RnfH superfamily antitoxin RatB of RatAB toxin-antitoxin module